MSRCPVRSSSCPSLKRMWKMLKAFFRFMNSTYQTRTTDNFTSFLRRKSPIFTISLHSYKGLQLWSVLGCLSNKLDSLLDIASKFGDGFLEQILLKRSEVSKRQSLSCTIRLIVNIIQKWELRPVQSWWKSSPVHRQIFEQRRLQ